MGKMDNITANTVCSLHRRHYEPARVLWSTRIQKAPSSPLGGVAPRPVSSLRVLSASRIVVSPAGILDARYFPRGGSSPWGEKAERWEMSAWTGAHCPEGMWVPRTDLGAIFFFLLVLIFWWEESNPGLASRGAGYFPLGQAHWPVFRSVDISPL